MQSWPDVLVGVVTILYAMTAVGYWITGQPYSGLVFLGYTVANVGLLLNTHH